MHWDLVLAKDFNGFKSQCSGYFRLLLNGENIRAYLGMVGKVVVLFIKGLCVVIPVIIVFVFIMKKIYKKSNNNHNRDTVPLRVFKWVIRNFFIPIKRAVQDLVCLLKEHKIVYILWIIIWCMNLNLASIVVGFFAYLFFFFMGLFID